MSYYRIRQNTDLATDFTPIHQKNWLSSGSLHSWTGPFETVNSPVILNEDEAPLVLGSYPLMDAQTSNSVLESAVKAWDNGLGQWPTMSVSARINAVSAFARDMARKKHEITTMLMHEIGKTAPDAEKEFDRTIDYISLTVEALKDLDRSSSRFSIDQGVFAQVRRAPLGVVLCMGPYNYPLNETFTTLIPALIMGNIVIFKPPKRGVLLHEPLLELFAKHFPAGTVNTVYGDGKEVITPLMKSGSVDVLAFIGSSKVADILKSLHPRPHRLRCVLGLEAKNAGIVMPDADMASTVAECISGSLSYNGQRCTALKILFVHDSRFDEFKEKYCAGVDALKTGAPWEAGVKITPMPDPESALRMKEIIDDALENGAKIINNQGGNVDGTLVYPTVLTDITPRMRIFREEQFGPIVPIIRWSEIREVLNYIVESNYGQQVSIFGSDPEKLGRLIDPLVNQVCRVNINSQCQRGPDSLPFTGRKDSAEGTLSISDALRVFTIRTLVAAKDNHLNREILRDIIHDHHSSFVSTDFIF